MRATGVRPAAMRSGASRRRYGRLTIAVLLPAALLLAGCSPAIGRLTTDSTPAPSQAKQVLTALAAAVTHRDRAGFDRVMAAAEPERRGVLWSNLAQLATLSFGVQPDARISTDWSVPGDSGVASQMLVARWRCNNVTCDLADLLAQPGVPAPIWVSGRIEVRCQEKVTIVDGRSSPTTDWLAAGRSAVDAISSAGLGPLALGWDAHLVVEVPADLASFAQVMGSPAHTFFGVGAVTWTQGQARRIVINPGAQQGMDAPAAQLLLSHEGTHVATASLGSVPPGWLWLSEGLADWVALAANPATTYRSTQTVVGLCQVAGGKVQLPIDTAMTTERSYAVAWAAIEQLSQRPAWQNTAVSWWQLPPDTTSQASARVSAQTSARTEADALLLTWCRVHLVPAQANLPTSSLPAPTSLFSPSSTALH